MMTLLSLSLVFSAASSAEGRRTPSVDELIAFQIPSSAGNITRRALRRVYRARHSLG
jgi:hypothetical protein